MIAIAASARKGLVNMFICCFHVVYADRCCFGFAVCEQGLVF